MNLHIAKDFSLPKDSVTQTFAILARRGRGKTYTASVHAEELIKSNLPFVVLDPTGAWWGLRAGKDGKAEGGYQVYVIGGDHGIPLEPTAGKVIADQVAEHPGSYVLDLSHFESNAAQDRFATDFAERLYRVKDQHRTPLHLFIDEADSFVPQRPMPGQQRMLGAFEAIVRRGRIKGIGVTLISQRPAVINKNVLTQTECMIVLQTTGPQDQKAIEEWIKAHCTEEQRKLFMSSLASLQIGEAWIWSPSWLDKFQKIHIRERETFNSGATPKAGDKVITPTLAAIDMDKLSAQIKATIEKAKENNVDELKKRVRELERAQTMKVATANTTDLQWYKDEIKKLTADKMILEREAETWQTIIDHKDKFLRHILSVAADSQSATVTMPDSKPVEMPSQKTRREKIFEARQSLLPKPILSATKPTYGEPTKPINSDIKIRAGAMRMLSVLIQWFPESMSEGQVRSHAGLKKSGTYGTYKSDLIVSGLIERRGNDLVATQKAVDEYGDSIADAPQTTEDVLAIWMPKLRAGAKRMLQVLIEQRRELTDAELLELSGMAKSGTYGTYKSDLRTAKLITVHGGYISANKETLFL